MDTSLEDGEEAPINAQVADAAKFNKKTRSSENETLFHKLRRLIVVEPYFMLYVIASYPSYGLSQQYFYHAVGIARCRRCR